MYQILIVDDESHVVEWLSQMFAHQDELEVITARSGEEALAWLERTHVDLVLSDIHMSGMSGLELMNHAVQLGFACRFIFLTGYNEFDTIYKATSHQRASFLLKTEDDEIILAEVNRVVSDIQEQQALLIRQKKQESLLRLISSRQFLLRMIEGSHRPVQLKTEQRHEIDDFAGHRYDVEKEILLVLGKIQNIDVLDPFDAYSSIEAILQDQAGQRLVIGQVDYRSNQLVWIIQSRESRTVANRLVRQMFEFLGNSSYEQLGIRLALLMDNLWINASAIPERFSRLYSVMDYLIGKEEGFVIQVQEDHLAHQQQPPLTAPVNVERLEHLLETGQDEAFQNHFDSMTRDLAMCDRRHDMQAVEAYSRIALMLLGYINKKRIQDKLMFRIGVGQLMRPFDFDTWFDAVAFLKQVTTEIFAAQYQESKQKRQYIISQIIDYVDKNMDKDLSLTVIADTLHYNPAYLSRLFKKINGVNLTDFILDARLNRAEHLLRQSNELVYVIAKLTGFESSQYFAKAFRKKYGRSPTDYRERSC